MVLALVVRAVEVDSLISPRSVPVSVGQQLGRANQQGKFFAKQH